MGVYCRVLVVRLEIYETDKCFRTGHLPKVDSTTS